MRRFSPLVVLLIVGAATAAPPPAEPPKETGTLEGTVAALYDVISGPAGKKRDWDRFRSLFYEGARLVPTGKRPEGHVAARVLDPGGYVERSSPLFEKQGFYEREVARRVERFGHVAHVFSTYEARHDPADAAPFLRGVNSIQLVNDGKRWWILTVLWEPESDELKLPERYLKTE